MATLEACNSNSRKRKQRIFEFKSFGNFMIDLSGPFRDNIRSFLDEYGEEVEYHHHDTTAIVNVWSTLLLCESNGAVFPLYTIEEPINQQSPLPFCSYCKSIGWGHHFVCKRRYRFMIPSYGDKTPLKDHLQNQNSLELDDTHVLHGLIHCNGFGHLISINKLDMGFSNSLSETDIMNLWDSICTCLKTRKISVADVKMERSMELRLIHGVAYENSWFGKWGYKFGQGSYGVTEDKYNRAVRFLGELDLDKIVTDFKNTRRGRKISQVLCKYRELAESRLKNLSDLFQFLLDLKPTGQQLQRKIFASSRKLLKPKHPTFDETQNPMCLQSFLTSLVEAECRWPQRRIEYTLEVIVNLLKEKNKAMSRQELRESARRFIGDTGLIDFMLKSINVLSLGNYIVRRVVNPLTKLVEFEIHEVVEDTKTTKLTSALWKLEPRWPKQRLEKTARVIVDILKESKALSNGRHGAMSRKELRDVASKYIGDTGLIDFVLKSIDNSMIENQIVTRTKNPLTRLMEFDIRDQTDEEIGGEEMDDVLFLYRNVLLGYPWWDSVSQASQVVLNSKHFVKEWEFRQRNDQLMTLTCRVLPSFDELETELTRPLPPGELVMVPPWMTVGELREVAQCALRDTYCVMDRFVVNQIGGLKGIRDELLLTCAVETGAQVWVRGCGLDLSTTLRYESGGGPAEEGKVDCGCGARDDDGERMVACDECHVWKHTRCSGIEDDEPAPNYFLCADCEAKSRSELLSQ